jgi:hypothetical protein
MTMRPEPYRRFQTERTFLMLDRFRGAARDWGVDPATLAIAW